ncbi:MAG: hypothetical protein MUE81_06235 [Thermoflexibacter sp.]|jgi:DNA-3-methyladenine glycosylase II|nr:hypothetical protein [Thermoflexibacter sp.]
MLINTFTEETLPLLVDKLVAQHAFYQLIVQQYGYPPFWHREPNFATLLKIILEQQVSLASAQAAYDRLLQKLGEVTPEKLLELTDMEMKECYFSRQKTIYARDLAYEIQNKNLIIETLNQKTDNEIRTALTKVKGLGEWSADVYLLLSLHRLDIFPAGDLAIVKALKQARLVSENGSRDEILNFADEAKPYRSIATYLLWHYYIKSRQEN